MHVHNNNTVPKLSGGLPASGSPKKAAGFGKEFGMALARANQSGCAPTKNDMPARNGRVELGTISRETPTVSHLLFRHPDLFGECWEIIHSPVNRDKPYTCMPPGTLVYMDAVTKELSWKGDEACRKDSLETGRNSGASRSGDASCSREPDMHADLEMAAIELSISRAAAMYDLPNELIRSVIRAESDFNVRAVSRAGAMGLMQLMPETARELGVTNPFDIRENIDAGSRYLKQMITRFGGDIRKGLAAYNAGPGTVRRFNGDVPYRETRQYVERVLSSLTDS